MCAVKKAGLSDSCVLQTVRLNSVTCIFCTSSKLSEDLEISKIYVGH